MTLVRKYYTIQFMSCNAFSIELVTQVFHKPASTHIQLVIVGFPSSDHLKKREPIQLPPPIHAKTQLHVQHTF